MEQHLEVTCEEKEIKTYVIEILTLGLGTMFLPVTFIKDDQFITGVYKAEGFRRLSTIEKMNTETILDIVLSLVHGIKDGENHCLFCDEYELSTETVLINEKSHVVKLVYVPFSEGKTGMSQLLQLLQLLGEKGSEESLGYVDSAISFMQENYSSYSAIVHYLEQLRNEVYLCNVQ
ncbi:hypothetical protein M2140_001336 [Clostridiales Family XIII bacterium PM5-7]